MKTCLCHKGHLASVSKAQPAPEMNAVQAGCCTHPDRASLPQKGTRVKHGAVKQPPSSASLHPAAKGACDMQGAVKPPPS